MCWSAPDVNPDLSILALFCLEEGVPGIGKHPSFLFDCGIRKEKL